LDDYGGRPRCAGDRPAGSRLEERALHVQPTATVSISAPHAAEIRLRLGAEVAARVVEAAGPDGRGLLSLAGALVRAKLPAGLAAGEKLRLRVAGQEGEQIVLRRIAEEEPAARGVPASAVAELAQRGDGEALRAAVALAGGPIPLPGGRVLVVEPEPDDTPAAADADGGSVRVVLHTPALGALELRLDLRAGVLDVGVTAGGDVARAAAEELPALREAVQSSTGVPTRIEVVERRVAPPAAPRVEPMGEVERFA
jgi:hypothetical protein